MSMQKSLIQFKKNDFIEIEEDKKEFLVWRLNYSFLLYKSGKYSIYVFEFQSFENDNYNVLIKTKKLNTKNNAHIMEGNVGGERIESYFIQIYNQQFKKDVLRFIFSIERSSIQYCSINSHIQ